MARPKYSEVEKKIMKGIALNLKAILKRKGMSQKELAEGIGLSTSVVSDYMNANILPTPGTIQSIADFLRVSKADIDPSFAGSGREATPNNIPLIGTICAGDGLLAEQNIEEYIHYPFQNKRQPDYALRVKGDSMIGAGIEDGDIVYMRHASWADYNGQIVAALIHDQEDGMLKRIRWSLDSPYIRLEPENEEYEVKEVRPNEITICGVYMGHFKPEREV